MNSWKGQKSQHRTNKNFYQWGNAWGVHQAFLPFGHGCGVATDGRVKVATFTRRSYPLAMVAGVGFEPTAFRL